MKQWIFFHDDFKSSITSYQLSTILSFKAIMKGNNEDVNIKHRILLKYIF